MSSKITKFFKLTVNNKTGYNLVFEGEPDEGTKAVLGAAKFRYSRVHKRWYSTDAILAKQIAKQLNAPELEDYDNSIRAGAQNTPQREQGARDVDTPIVPKPESVEQLPETQVETGNGNISTGSEVGEQRIGGKDDSQSDTLQQVAAYDDDSMVEQNDADKALDNAPILPDSAQNFVMDEGTNTPNRTPTQRFLDNLAALRLLVALETKKVAIGKNVEYSEVQETLSKFSGWGGITNIQYLKNLRDKGEWALRIYIKNEVEAARLVELYKLFNELDPKGTLGVLNEAVASTLNAHYTNTPIIRAIYACLDHMGFKGGRILEPSAGIGSFFAAMPKEMAAISQLFAVEKDVVTGKILQYLYPKAYAIVSGLEQTELPSNYFDLIISNIPFGEFKVYDKSFANKGNTTEKRSQNKIQDYFFVKSIDLCIEGGIIAFITSSGTLNASNSNYLREYIDDKCNFLGAIRLPSNAFKDTANTEVTTDIIFLQKRGKSVTILPNPNILDLEAINVQHINSGELGATTTNKYFVDNPSFVIGAAKRGGQWSGDRLNIVSDLDANAIAQKMIEIADKEFEPIYQDSQQIAINDTQNVYSGSKGDYLRQGNIIVNDGQILKITDDRSTGKFQTIDYGKEIFTDKTTEKRKQRTVALFEAYSDLRKSLKLVFDKELNGASDEQLNAYRKNLNLEYEAFIEKFGDLHSKDNSILLHDIDVDIVFALEYYDANAKQWQKASVFKERTLQIRTKSAANIGEAILICLDEKGKIIPGRIAELLNTTTDKLAWGKFAFEMPNGEVIEASEYLSGNVVEKLEQAEKLAAFDEKYQKNVLALKEVQPEPVPIQDIYIQLGARWVKTSYYDEFAKSILGEAYGVSYRQTSGGSADENTAGKTQFGRDEFVVTKDKSFRKKQIFGIWDATFEAGGNNLVIKYGYEILRAALNQKEIIIKDTHYEGSKKVETINERHTAICANKKEAIIEEFNKWIKADRSRREWLETEYNRRYNNIVERPNVLGNYLTLSGFTMPPNFVLGSHILPTVERVVTKDGLLVDHTVGAGKTLVAIISAMKLKQMGKIRKPLLVLLKSTIQQITDEARRFYPNAKILAPTEDDFSAKNRRLLMALIATNTWDLIIISHEQLATIPEDSDVAVRLINDELGLLDIEMEYWNDENQSLATKTQLKGLEKRKQNLMSRLLELKNMAKDPNYLHFGQLGIDHILVDEAHRFKNLQYTTRHDQIAGLGPPEGSKRAFNLYSHIASIRSRYYNNEDKGLTLLTGTPITNSVVEMFTMLRYMIPKRLQEMSIQHFDAWAAQFAVPSRDIEFDVTANLKRKMRFRTFINVPELSKLYRFCADVKTDKNLPELQQRKPHLRGGNMILVTSEISCEQQAVMIDIIRFLKLREFKYIVKYIRSYVNKDSYLKARGLVATNLSQKASIDTRLLKGSDDIDDFGNKVNEAVRYIAAIYHQTTEQKGVQLVFSNTGVPGSDGFNVYDEIKQKLVGLYKIAPNEIQFIHSYNSHAARARFFDNIIAGNVRIVIGSTEKLGTGVNVQQRIVALHHLDLQWTPALLEQRNGRGLRQGNLFQMKQKDFSIPVFVYATKRTLDAYKFELLKTKQAFIDQIRDGSITARSIDEGDMSSDDGDSASVGFATFVSEVSGNPYIKKVAQLEQKVKDFETARKNYEAEVWRIDGQREIVKKEIETINDNIERHQIDIATLVKAGVMVQIEGGKYEYKPNLTIKDENGNEVKITKPSEIGTEILKAKREGRTTVGYMPFELTVEKHEKFGYTVIAIYGFEKKYIIDFPYDRDVTASNVSQIITYGVNGIWRNLNTLKDRLEFKEKELARIYALEKTGWSKDAEYTQAKEDLKKNIELRDNSIGDAGTEKDIIQQCRAVLSKPPVDVLQNPAAIYDYGKLPDISDLTAPKKEVATPTATATIETADNTDIEIQDDDNSNGMEVPDDDDTNQLVKRLEKTILAFKDALSFADDDADLQNRLNNYIQVFTDALELAA
jgi:N12 class adenine-specific DNA methylase